MRRVMAFVRRSFRSRWVPPLWRPCKPPTQQSARSRLGSRLVLPLVFVFFGLALFAWFARDLNWQVLSASVWRAGVRFPQALALFVVAEVLSAACWNETLGPPARRPRFRNVVAAQWVGHAVGLVVPGGALGELVKGGAVARAVGGERMAASLLIYNYLTVALNLGFAVFAAAGALLWPAVPVDFARLLGFGICATLVVLGLLRWGLRDGVLSRVVRLAARVLKLPPERATSWTLRAQRVQDLTERFAQEPGNPAVRFAVFAALSRLCLGLELWLFIEPALLHLGGLSVVAIALLLQASLLISGMVAVFIPGRLGVSEALGVMLFTGLGLPPAIAVSALLLRRVRQLLSLLVAVVVAPAVLGRMRRPRDESMA